MRILKQERENNIVKIEVEATPEALTEEKERVLRHFAKRVKIPGFRAGKAPRHLLLQELSPETQKAQAIDNLISKLYGEVLDETQLEPIDRADVQLVKEAEDEPIVIGYTIPVPPQVEVNGYKEIGLSPITVNITEEEVGTVLHNMQERMAAYPMVKDRPTQEGDLVQVSVTALKEGKAYKPLTKKDAGLVLGQKQLSQEFDQALLGLSLGATKSFTLKFPEDTPDPDLKGQEIHFDIELSSIAEKKLPELTDTFAKKVGGDEVETLEALKERIRHNLAKQKKEEAEREERNTLLDQIIDKTPLELPEKMIERETDLMSEELKGNLSRDKLSFEDYLSLTKKTNEDFRASCREGATRRLKSKLILEAIAKQEGLTLTNEELETEMTQLANAAQKTLAAYRSGLSRSGMNYIQKVLLRQKAFQWVYEQAKAQKT